MTVETERVEITVDRVEHHPQAAVLTDGVALSIGHAQLTIGYVQPTIDRAQLTDGELNPPSRYWPVRTGQPRLQ